ncbi:Alpha/Beta hydrolase protein [Flagelloscypha sp. PMI_526]|nr:Alpha/Beta hydrolase protein [Flagelloscypha sp. PMI_526]
MTSYDPENYQLLDLPDARKLSYAIHGDTASSAVVFYFHGFPGSRLEGQFLHEKAAVLGIRVISIDRPGMGRSSFQTGRTLLDWPTDVLALADYLNIDKFAVLGVSGGGPYVLACCHAIPSSRLVASAIACGLYPPKLGTSGMLFPGRVLLWVAPYATSLISWMLDWEMGAKARDTDHPHLLGEALDKVFETRQDVEKKVWFSDEQGFRRVVLDTTREAFREGAAGSGWEAKLYGENWGFELTEIQIQEGSLKMWHGSLDANSPVQMAEKATPLIKGSKLVVVPGEGHCGLSIHQADEALKFLGTFIL